MCLMPKKVTLLLAGKKPTTTTNLKKILKSISTGHLTIFSGDLWLFFASIHHDLKFLLFQVNSKAFHKAPTSLQKATLVHCLQRKGVKEPSLCWTPYSLGNAFLTALFLPLQFVIAATQESLLSGKGFLNQ